MKCVYVVPYLTASESLKAAIAFLLKSPDASVVAVKDEPHGGADNDAALSVARRERLHLIADGQHKGYSRAVNLGVRHAIAELQPDLICISNDDVRFSGELPPDLQSLPSDAGLVGVLSNRAGYQSLIYSFDDNGDFLYPAFPETELETRYASALARLGRRYMPVPLVHGFCFFLRPQVFTQVDGLDEKSFPDGYGSDFDLSLRVEAAGFRNTVWSGAFVWHEGSRSSGRDRRRIHAISADFILKQRYGERYKDARFRTRNRMQQHLGNLIDLS